jgi:hypothetical protein
MKNNPFPEAAVIQLGKISLVISFFMCLDTTRKIKVSEPNSRGDSSTSV